jgi:hypothetical protein
MLRFIQGLASRKQQVGELIVFSPPLCRDGNASAYEKQFPGEEMKMRSRSSFIGESLPDLD